MDKRILLAVIGLAGMGLVDALYLAHARFTHSELACSILDGCNVVAASSHSVLLGVPLAYLGVAFYASVLLLGLLLMRFKHTCIQSLLLCALVGGALSSLYFLYVQAVLIEAFCLYCLISAGISFILLGLGVWYVKSKSKVIDEHHVS